MHTKTHLSFSALRKLISDRVSALEDIRQEAKVRYEIHDCCLSAFAMMFFQDRSLLAFQKRLKEASHQDNLKTLFNVTQIPKSTQLRDVLDTIDASLLEPLFADFFAPLQRGKHLNLFRVFGDMYLVALDGTQYFSSENIFCPSCLQKKTQNGISYYHQVVAATIVCPGVKQVIPLAPEPIRNTDGQTKQDCELNASKRLVQKIRLTHPKLKIIITGDDLYSNQPFIDALKTSGMSFILVAKPSNHKILFQWIDDFKKMEDVSHLEIKDDKGRIHIYQWRNDIPLNGTQDADSVNYFEYSIRVKNRVNYHNSWVTDISITPANIKDLVKAGRARWKIENEAFNTLKNQGYHLEHNFGHGQHHLSYNLLLLNFLAFFMHQIFELTDLLYQKCRQEFSSRKDFWNQLRYTIRLIVFPRWGSLLQFILAPKEGVPP